MSDSEYDSEFVAAQTAKTTKKPSTSSSSTTPASRKRKSTSSKDTKSDSEYDSEFVAAQTAKSTKKPSTSSSSTTPASRKRKSTRSKDTKNKKSTTVDIFGLGLSEEVEVSQPKPTSLASHITYRVANGTQRRSAVTEGDFYVELKVFHRDDAESAAPDERWKKALLRTNCCLQSESSQFDHLQRFVREIHLLFKDSAPAFVGDKFK